MIKKIFISIFLFVVAFCSLFSNLALAAGAPAAEEGGGEIGITEQPANGGIQINCKNGNQLLGSITQNLIVLFFTVGGISFVIMFLWGAVNWIISGGDKEKVASARKRITTAIIGLVLLSLTFVIMGVLSQVLGFDLFGQFSIPNFGGQQQVAPCK